MHTLFVSELLPPDTKQGVYGYSQRILMLLEAATRIGTVELFFFTYEGQDSSEKAVAMWQAYFSKRLSSRVSIRLHPFAQQSEMSPYRIAALFWRCALAGAFSPTFGGVSPRSCGARQVEAVRGCLDKTTDLIIAHNLGGCAPLLFMSGELPPIVFDLDGVERDKYTQFAQLARSPLRKLWHACLYPLLLRGERKSIARSRLTFVSSDQDRDRLERQWQLPGIVTVPNAVELRPPSPICPAPTMMFVGTYDYWPNRDAADYFITEIFPRIKRQRPEAQLLLVGPKPDVIRSYSAKPEGIEFRGFVEDLGAVYSQTRVVICPLRAGCGTRLKILEALAYGKPTVSTTLGAEGIDLMNERDILLRDGAEEFADACVELLANDEKCRALSEAARRRVQDDYQRESVVRLIADYYREAAGRDAEAKAEVSAGNIKLGQHGVD